MASEYLKKKYRDVKPDPPLVLTKAQKRKNWWHYHKWHIAVAAVLLLSLGSIAWNVLSRVEPDYRIAYVGTNALPDDTAAALEAGFAALGEDPERRRQGSRSIWSSTPPTRRRTPAPPWRLRPG